MVNRENYSVYYKKEELALCAPKPVCSILALCVPKPVCSILALCAPKPVCSITKTVKDWFKHTYVYIYI